MSLLILRGLLLAAEALLISALLPLMSWAVSVFLRKHASLRHLVWLAVFGVLVALPLLALMVPAHTLMLKPATPVRVDVVMAAPVVATYVDHWSLEAIIAAAVAPLCAIWLAGVAWNLLRLALGLHGLARLRRTSVAFDRIQGCDVRLGGGPLTFGFFKPVIILPKDARDWPRARLDAVLRHEMAHVRRYDSLTQWLAALACAFYWPNPLVWLGARALRRDAEMAADDMVLASGVQASVYAAELVRLAALAQGPRLLTLAMAQPSSLEARVTAVLSPAPSRAGVSAATALKLGLMGSACAVALAFARPDLAMAQNVQPAPVTAVPQTTQVDGDHLVTTDTVIIDKSGKRTEIHTRHVMTAQERARLQQSMTQAQVAREGAQGWTQDDREEVRIQAEQSRQQADQTREQADRLREQADLVRQQADQAREQADRLREQADLVRQQADQVRQQADRVRASADAMRAHVAANAQVWRVAAGEIREAVHQAPMPPMPPIPPIPPVPAQ